MPVSAAVPLLALAVFASCSGTTKPPPEALTNPLDAGGEGTDATTPSGGADSSMTTPPVDAGEPVDQGSEAPADANDEPEAAQVVPSTCVATDPDASDVKPMMCNGQCVNVDTDPMNCGGCSQPCGSLETMCDFGVCQCPPAQTCGTQCVDLTQDQSNCGFCDHNCQGNPCMAGLCQASSIAQVTLSNEFLSSIAVDSTTVYWTQGTSSGAGVYSKPFAGGMPNQLGATNDPRGIVVDLTNVYWVDYGDGSVNKAALLGGGASELLAPDDSGTVEGPLALAVDGQNVYWVDSAAGTVNEMPIQGGAVTPLASGRVTPRAIAVDATSVYWIDYGSQPNSGSINKIDIAGLQPIKQLATGENEPYSIALDATSVYWTDRANSTGAVKKVPIGGGTVVTIAQSQGAPYGIAVDSQYVYWTNYDDNTVMKAPLAGGKAYTLASAQNNPTAIAVDLKNVYWANFGSGVILKVAK